MKLLFLIAVSTAFSIALYILTSYFAQSKKINWFRWKPIQIAGFVFICLMGLIVYGVYTSANQPDIQCTKPHSATSKLPTNLQSADDYFQKGNYDYDTGNCKKALEDYTKAIALSPKFTQAYNNRAYTNMRLRNYQNALTDLDTAILLNPNYVQALMNRGDIYNFYYQIDRQKAIADYRRVLTITGPGDRDTSVCGHLFLAKHNGWTPGAYLDFFTGAFKNCQ